MTSLDLKVFEDPFTLDRAQLEHEMKKRLASYQYEHVFGTTVDPRIDKRGESLYCM